MKNKILKLVMVFIGAAILEGIYITLLTLLCSRVIAPKNADISGTVRGFGLILGVIGEDSLSVRACRRLDVHGAFRWLLDAAAFVGGLAFAFMLMSLFGL